MKNNSDVSNVSKSIALSRVIAAVFALAIFALDIGVIFIDRLYELAGFLPDAVADAKIRLLALCVLMCSPAGYVMLWKLRRLLKNIGAGVVFDEANVSLMRMVSICCFIAAFFCMGFAFLGMWSLLSITFAAGFVGLIVRIVGNVFEQAIQMKDELDLTV